MVNPDIAGGLRSLHGSLESLKALEQWTLLVQEQKQFGHHPHGFNVETNLAQEIHTEIAFFMNTATELSRCLNRKDIQRSRQQKLLWRRRLESLVGRFRNLSITTGL